MTLLDSVALEALIRHDNWLAIELGCSPPHCITSYIKYGAADEPIMVSAINTDNQRLHELRQAMTDADILVDDTGQIIRYVTGSP